MLIDTHAHLSARVFAQDLTEVMQRAADNGVGRIVTIATDLEDARRVCELADGFPNVWGAVGLHPTSFPETQFSDMEELARLVSHPKVVAIGETGLDYYHSTEHVSAQKELFLAHLELARCHHLPVVIHNRNADTDMLTMLCDNVPNWQPWGVMHCFSGDEKFALRCIEIGLLISFTGILTFKNSAGLRAVAASAPLEKVMLETDCPYLAPGPHRGKRNEPSYIPLIAQALAEIKGVSVEDVARVTTQNAEQLFSFGRGQKL